MSRRDEYIVVNFYNDEIVSQGHESFKEAADYVENESEQYDDDSLENFTIAKIVGRVKEVTKKVIFEEV